MFTIAPLFFFFRICWMDCVGKIGCGGFGEEE